MSKNLYTKLFTTYHELQALNTLALSSSVLF